jgi:hypothetical protein
MSLDPALVEMLLKQGSTEEEIAEMLRKVEGSESKEAGYRGAYKDQTGPLSMLSHAVFGGLAGRREAKSREAMEADIAKARTGRDSAMGEFADALHGRGLEPIQVGATKIGTNPADTSAQEAVLAKPSTAPPRPPGDPSQQQLPPGVVPPMPARVPTSPSGIPRPSPTGVSPPGAPSPEEQAIIDALRAQEGNPAFRGRGGSGAF